MLFLLLLLQLTNHAVSLSSKCDYDIKKIINNPSLLSDKKDSYDYYFSNRKYYPHYYLTKNSVIYYGNSSCFKVTHQNIIDVGDTYEEYLPKIEEQFALKQLDTLKYRRYAIYITNTGLHPNPPDPAVGISGYGGDYLMALFPDVVINIVSDPSVLIHEIGHSLVHLPESKIWLGESICVYIAHIFVPSVRTIYDTTFGYVIKHHYANIFGIKSQTTNKYDYGAFWKFIEYEYKNAKNLGKILYNLTDNTKDIWDHVANTLNSCESCNMNTCSNTSNKFSEDLIVRWVINIVQLKFWRDDEITYNSLKKYMKTDFVDKETLVWNKPTIRDINQLNDRIEKGGFEVLPYANYILPDTYRWKKIYITHYTDNTYKVSKYDTNDKNIKIKLIAIIRVS